MSSHCRFRQITSRILQKRLATDGLVCTALVLLAGLAIAHALTYPSIETEEAFGTFRHAMNLVRGRGFSCSAGGRVEGTLSPLLALFLAPPIWMGVEPYPIAKLLGTSAFALCTLAAYAAVRTCVEEPWSRFLGLAAAAMVAASPTLAYHSQTGLETLVYSGAVMVALWLHLRGTKSSSQARVGWVVALGVASLLRPEGLLLFLVLWVASLAFGVRSPHAWTRAALHIGVFAFVVIPWGLFRRAYFGGWLPELLVSTAAGPSAAGTTPDTLFGTLRNGAGTELLLKYVADHPLGTGMLAGTVLLRRTRYAGLLIALIALGCATVVTWNSRDWVTQDRWLAPCIAPLAAGTALGLRGLLFHDEQRARHGHALSAIIAATAVAIVLRDSRRIPVHASPRRDQVEMKELGLRLAAVTRSDEMLVSELSGALPFYWGATTVDIDGPCSIAAAAGGSSPYRGSGRPDWGRLVSQKPTWYAFKSAYTAAVFYEIPAFRRFRDHYYLLQFPYRYLPSKTFVPPTLLVRKDRPEVGQAARELGLKLVDAGEELRRTGFLP